MKVGLVCPYTWDIPGGVSAHIHDLAKTLIGFGHDVSVITPADDDFFAAAVRRVDRPRDPGALQRRGGAAWPSACSR